MGPYWSPVITPGYVNPLGILWERNQSLLYQVLPKRGIWEGHEEKVKPMGKYT